MTDYRKWKHADVKVTEIELDPRNPRIPAGTEIRSTRDLIAELVEHDDVFGLAKSISEEGYFPYESLIGLEEDGKKIILEGNRRLAALRCLINPDAAPEAYKKKFRSLANDMDATTIEKVPVVFAPSRKAAAPLIAARHTITQVSKWSPIQQARYYRALVQSGLTIEEAAKAGRRTPSEVAAFLRSDLMYEVACSLDGLRESTRAVVHDPRKFALSNLERLLDTPAVRVWLGVDFDESGNPIGKIDAEEFKKGYRRLVSDVADGAFDSRKQNTTKAIEDYLANPDMTGDIPDKRKRGKFTSKELLKADTTMDVAPSPPARNKPFTTKKSRSMVPIGFKCEVENPRIKSVFHELKKLYLVDYPNSAGVMLRVLFELSLGYYLEKSKKIQPLLDKAKKDGKPDDWFPTLRHLLRHGMKDSELTAGLSPLNRKNLNKAVDNDNHIFSIDAMDGIVHNRYGHLTEDYLRGLWHSVEDLLKVTLVEYKPPSSPAAPAKPNN